MEYDRQTEQYSAESIQFIWDCTPNSKNQQARCVIPSAVHYSPLQQSNLTRLNYQPMMCSCEAVMNNYCYIDFHTKTIKCCICSQVTSLPANYAQQITPSKLPYEFMPTNTSFEYLKSPPKNKMTQGYLFVVDLCISEKQMSSIKEQIVKVIQSLPDNIHVGLITYNRHVNIYELNSKINMLYCINGSNNYQLSKLMNLIEINIANSSQMKTPDIIQKFMPSVQNNRAKLIRRIQSLKIDSFIYVNQRNDCALGQALNIAISMAQVSTINIRIIMLVGGPCTVGSGKVINTDFKSQMRSAKQLSSGENIPYFQSAKKYYDSLCKRVVNQNIIIDLFGFTLSEFGFSQMSQIMISSGGIIMMNEQFKSHIFKQSFFKIFPRLEQEHSLASQGILMIYCSNQIVINGALGNCYSLNKYKNFVSSKQIGQGKTHAWYLGSLDANKTITIVYETKQPLTNAEVYYMQFKTSYKNSKGQNIIRITTTKRIWSNQIQQIAQGFNQQAAIVYLARQVVHKTIYEEQTNMRQWLDGVLCRWAQYFANFIKNDENSFCLPTEMKGMPQLIYHLRRSHLVNRFGISLDEYFYIGHILNRQSIQNCLTMIRPILVRYTIDQLQPVPVGLDQQEMKSQVVLLLDSFFVVIEWYGEDIQSWYENGYHLDQQYQHIADLFNAPKQDIDYIMKNRLPIPNYFKVHPNHSKERYLKSRVNPKKNGGVENENMLTDDSDLRAFTRHLIKVVVNHH